MEKLNSTLCPPTKSSSGFHTYECEKCDKTLTIKCSLNRHYGQIHTLRDPIKCPHCNKLLKNYPSLKSHVRIHHSYVPRPKCQKEVPERELKKHIKRHEEKKDFRACAEQKGYTCYFCHKEFNRLDRLTQHLRCLHTKENPSLFYGTKCQFKTTRAEVLAQHENYKHTKNTCYFCGFKSAHQDSISRHLMVKHIKEKPFKCEFCPKKYPIFDTLKKHMRRGGPTKEDKMKHGFGLFHTKVECPKCFKVIERNYLTQHLNLHGEAKYKCTLCTKVFRSSKARLAHKKRNHDDKPKNMKFECTVCRRLFSSKSSLERHMRTHKTGRTKETCHLCGVRLLPECYNTHISMVHGPPRFHCYFCGNRFTSPNAMSRHLLSQHIKEKPFKCNNCPNFHTCHPYVLTRHMRTHHDGKKKEYFCYFCNRRYLNLSYFRDHVNSHLVETKVEEPLGKPLDRVKNLALEFVSYGKVKDEKSEYLG